MSGTFVAVVGPSGAGKDAVLAVARQSLGDSRTFVFPRRSITRPEGPGEDHTPLTAGEFAEAEAGGQFALTWQAHGLSYGIPASAAAEVAAGRVVVVNVSRGVLGTLAEMFERFRAVQVTVSPEVRRARIAGRGREGAAAASARLERPDPAPDHPFDLEIVNDGPLEDSAARLVGFLERVGPVPMLKAQLRALPALAGTVPSDRAFSGPSRTVDASALPTAPNALFEQWLRIAQAGGVPEPHAMTVSTVDAEGVPDARVLLLKGLSEAGWEFSGPASGRRGAQLRAHPAAALSFWWQEIVRAVRVRGTVVEAPRTDSEADLAARGASARAEIAPGDWTLWRLRPTRVEFWEGAADRQHTRIVYAYGPAGWELTVTSRGTRTRIY